MFECFSPSAASPEQKLCPYLGRFSVTGLRPPESCASAGAEELSTLVVGCSTGHTMEFRSDCATEDFVSSECFSSTVARRIRKVLFTKPWSRCFAAYSCHGRWEDNGTHFLITTPLSRTSHGARRLCFMYRESDGMVHFSSSSDSCQRGVAPGIGGTLAFNVTSTGTQNTYNRSPILEVHSSQAG